MRDDYPGCALIVENIDKCLLHISLYTEQTLPTRMSPLHNREVAYTARKGNCYMARFSFRTGNSG